MISELWDIIALTYTWNQNLEIPFADFFHIENLKI